MNKSVNFKQANDWGEKRKGAWGLAEMTEQGLWVWGRTLSGEVSGGGRILPFSESESNPVRVERGDGSWDVQGREAEAISLVRWEITTVSQQWRRGTVWPIEGRDKYPVSTSHQRTCSICLPTYYILSAWNSAWDTVELNEYLLNEWKNKWGRAKWLVSLVEAPLSLEITLPLLMWPFHLCLPLAALCLHYRESLCPLLCNEHLSEAVCCVGHNTVGTKKL